MGAMKEFLMELEDNFVAEHEREPTEEELQGLYEDAASAAYDRAKDARKYGDL